MKKRWVKIRDLYYKGISVVDISNKLGCSYSCVYSAIFEMKRRDLIDDNMKDGEGFGGSDKSKPLLKKKQNVIVDDITCRDYWSGKSVILTGDVVGKIKEFRDTLDSWNCKTANYLDLTIDDVIKEFVRLFGEVENE